MYLKVLVLFFLFNSYLGAECIGVVTAGGGKGFWTEVRKGAQSAARELGISVYVRGAVDEINTKGQLSIIDTVINQEGCIGLVLAPNSKKHLKIVSELKRKGIPTVYIDRDIQGERVSVIKTNNELAGKLAAQEMVRVLKGKGKVAVLRLNKSVSTTNIRENSFIKEAKKGGLEVVIDEYIGTRVGDARKNAYEILSIRDDITGIFTPNESTSMGVIKVLERLNQVGKIIHIGFDSSSFMIQSLKSEHIYGFIVQKPFMMGYEGVYAVYSVLQGNTVKKQLDTGVIFVHKNNIDKVNVRKFLGQ